MYNVHPIAPKRLPELLKRMPKAELHIHIEGSLEPELIFKLSKKNNIPIPYENVEALRSAYAFNNLQSFLDIYYAGASVLITEDDFYEMAHAYFLKAAQDHVVHAELFFDPQTHTVRGVPMQAIIHGLSRACKEAEQTLGITTCLILCFLRHLSEEDALKTLEEAMPFKNYLVGVGLDSGEVGNPPEKFSKVFAKCKALGLKLVAHAGEEGPPSYIWSALDVLGVQRIDHGVQCIKDPELINRLRLERTPLTVCPLSNLKLKVFSSLADHNIAKLLAEGLCVTINSDDPAYFGGYIYENFLQTFEALGLGAKEAYAYAHNSFEASFMTTSEKEKRYHELKVCFESFVEHDA